MFPSANDVVSSICSIRPSLKLWRSPLDSVHSLNLVCLRILVMKLPLVFLRLIASPTLVCNRLAVLYQQNRQPISVVDQFVLK